jgi:hypothetical protein
MSSNAPTASAHIHPVCFISSSFFGCWLHNSSGFGNILISMHCKGGRFFAEQVEAVNKFPPLIQGIENMTDPW